MRGSNSSASTGAVGCSTSSLSMKSNMSGNALGSPGDDGNRSRSNMSISAAPEKVVSEEPEGPGSGLRTLRWTSTSSASLMQSSILPRVLYFSYLVESSNASFVSPQN